jgi:hypothetical protein
LGQIEADHLGAEAAGQRARFEQCGTPRHHRSIARTLSLLICGYPTTASRNSNVTSMKIADPA